MKKITGMFGFRRHALIAALKLILQFVFYFTVAGFAWWGVDKYILHSGVAFDGDVLKWLSVAAFASTVLDRRTVWMEKTTIDSANFGGYLRRHLPDVITEIQGYAPLENSERISFVAVGVFDDLKGMCRELEQQLVVVYQNSTIDFEVVVKGASAELRDLLPYLDVFTGFIKNSTVTDEFKYLLRFMKQVQKYYEKEG